jgi:hypothetical protein
MRRWIRRGAALAAIGWSLAARADAPPTCGDRWTDPPDRVSVAWISPVRRRTTAAGWLDVIPTAALRDWVTAEHPSTGRFLQRLGLRRRDRDPRRRWKVTIFEVRSSDLCRPLDDLAGAAAGGVVGCEAPRSAHRLDSCGLTADPAGAARGIDLYRIRWRDAAPLGFCVLPLERFVSEPR